MKSFGKVLLIVVFGLMWLWNLGASRYAAGGLGWVAMGAYALITVAVLIQFRKRIIHFLVVTWILSLVWFWSLTPSNDRDWSPPVARLATAQIDGSEVVVRNVRNFRYRSPEDYDVRWEDRTYDLDELTGADLVMCHWGIRAIAHTMMSFEFNKDEYLCLSVETRNQEGETWNPIAGIYRQAEIVYVLGDERDLINLRTSYRDEEVHLYHLRLDPAQVRRYFIRVLERINELASRPEFYNTIDYNCTSALTRVVEEIWPERRHRGGFRSILNGYAAQDAQEQGYILKDIPFEELRKKCYISEVARQYRDDSDFSIIIREDLPR